MSDTLLLSSPWFPTQCIEVLGWALFHSVWQFAGIAILGYLCSGLMKQATIRYNLWLVVLGCMTVSPLITVLLHVNSVSERNRNASLINISTQNSFFAAADTTIEQNETWTVPSGNTAGVPVSGVNESQHQGATENASGNHAVAPLKHESASHEWQETVRPWLSSLVAVWAFGVALFAVRPLLGMRIVKRLKTQGLSKPDPIVLDLIRGLEQRLQIRPSVQAFFSDKVQVPVVIGCFKSLILLPVAMVANLSPIHLEALLAHELAHVKRWDYLTNLLQTMVETVFFYHPAVWWVSNRIRIERENCCDDLAVAALNNRIEYGRALVALDEWRAESVLVLGANDGSLQARVLRLLVSDPQISRQSLSLPHVLLVVLFLATAIGGIAFASWNFSPVPDPESQEKAKSDSTLASVANVQDSTPRVLDQENESHDLRDQLDPHERWLELGLDFDGVPDVSSWEDPLEIIRELEDGKKFAYIVMPGGFAYFWPQGSAPPIDTIGRFNATFFQAKTLDPRVRRLIELGKPAREAIHERILRSRLTVMIPFTFVLGRIGDSDSIELLIQALEKLDNLGPARGLGPREHAPFAITCALWELTGQKHDFSPQQWRDWWEAVKPGYVVARERNSHVLSERQVAELVEPLIELLEQQPKIARDRLLAQGQSIVPYLQKILTKLLAENRSDSNNDDHLLHLAWVLDELEGTNSIPRELLVRYFAERFAHAKSEYVYQPAPDEMTAFYRAMNACSFAEICQIIIDMTRRNSSAVWPIRYESISRRFDTVPKHIVPPINYPGYTEITPTTEPVAEMAEAVIVLCRALQDEQAVVRVAAARLSEMIVFSTDFRPPTLCKALADVWLNDTDPTARYQAGFALARSRSEVAAQVFSPALRSNRPEIVSEAVGFFGELQLVLNETTRADFELIRSLTRAEDRKLRTRAVRSLQYRAPELLFTELERLVYDPVEDIRNAITYLQVKDNPPEFIEALFVLANDVREPIRTRAISKIGSLQRPELIPRLRPFLTDKQVWGFAVAAMVQSGPNDALPVLMQELQGRNDVGGMVYQHLKRITGQSFDDQPEPWLEWWNANK